MLQEKNIDIKDFIYEVRGKKVMLDSDVAYLFGYEVKQLNRQVNRNINRFPDNYCFRLTKKDVEKLWCQNGTAKLNVMRRTLPYVFTEYGITMLAGLLKSDVYEIKNKLLEHDKNFKIIFDKFDKKKEFINKIFYNGEIYDTYGLLIDIIRKANNNIIIIDNYIDKTVLYILTNKNVNTIVYLITDEKKCKVTDIDILKFNEEYPKLEIKYTNKFHDRFIIIDRKEIYHIGALLKDLGNKVFAISKIKDKEIIKNFIFMIDM